MSEDILQVIGLGKQFGGLKAVDGLSFSVKEGTIHGLIGPNGAGKTTTFNIISGFYSLAEGDVKLGGESISGLQMFEVARCGVVRTFQHSTLFAEMTVLENALIGTHRIFPPKFLAAVFGWDLAERRKVHESAVEALEFFGLLPFSGVKAGDLPHGHQRALGMAVALACRPKVMMLDEPFTGMNLEETSSMMDLMFKLSDAGITILIVEHDMRAVMGLCNWITVMNFGKLLTEGRPEEIRQHPGVIEAYLGSVRDVA